MGYDLREREGLTVVGERWRRPFGVFRTNIRVIGADLDVFERELLLNLLRLEDRFSHSR